MRAPAIALIERAARTGRCLIKICGFTEPDGLRAAVDAGVDAVGFNFWRGSKRFIDQGKVAGWVREMPEDLPRIGVFVNPEDDEIVSMVETGIVQIAQLHGTETPEQCQRLMARGIPVIKAFGWTGPEALSAARACATPYLLADAHAPGAYGGTGRTLDWEQLAEAVADAPDLRLVLSGGLTPGNVGLALATVRPVMVDTASGVESAPGVKDPVKVREFVAAVRAT